MTGLYGECSWAAYAPPQGVTGVNSIQYFPFKITIIDTLAYLIHINPQYFYIDNQWHYEMNKFLMNLSFINGLYMNDYSSNVNDCNCTMDTQYGDDNNNNNDYYYYYCYMSLFHQLHHLDKQLLHHNKQINNDLIVNNEFPYFIVLLDCFISQTNITTLLINNDITTTTTTTTTTINNNLPIIYCLLLKFMYIHITSISSIYLLNDQYNSKFSKLKIKFFSQLLNQLQLQLQLNLLYYNNNSNNNNNENNSSTIITLMDYIINDVMIPMKEINSMDFNENHFLLECFMNLMRMRIQSIHYIINDSIININNWKVYNDFMDNLLNINDVNHSYYLLR
ncbi:unnamed protein product [Schistosoma mattheei]|uniref:Uncharacterized protein n=1 Tax=Schistosoma mattheei TaxID=31246 RepID=A0A183PX43_9TREM|nr:unnamed protein product [Schistosoma mattheei]